MHTVVVVVFAPLRYVHNKAKKQCGGKWVHLDGKPTNQPSKRRRSDSFPKLILV